MQHKGYIWEKGRTHGNLLKLVKKTQLSQSRLLDVHLLLPWLLRIVPADIEDLVILI